MRAGERYRVYTKEGGWLEDGGRGAGADPAQWAGEFGSI